MSGFLKQITLGFLFGPVISTYIPTRALRSLRQVAQKAKDLIDKKKQSGPDESAMKSDLLEILVNASRTDEEITDTFITDEAKTFLVAGHETTSGLLSWSAYLTALHPHVLEKARAEIDAVVGDEPFVGEHIPKLSFLFLPQEWSDLMVMI
eukprot:TRINITY_DN10441_c0_g1_i1.p1 TRINITY_DN10441_c0_g1~~TRINITY_DN10441_c0_g1_i1.p1  ORF type:complete len:151 (+),score=37.39 TRINITY_DN10441_c0_g1_i1:82-534(+)